MIATDLNLEKLKTLKEECSDIRVDHLDGGNREDEGCGGAEGVGGLGGALLETVTTVAVAGCFW